MLGFGLAKKVIGKIISLAFTLLILGALLYFLNPGKMIRKGITSMGPKVTGTTVSLSDIGVSWLSGKGEIKGLILGSPEGFKAESAMEIPVATIAVRPTSIFSDKIIIKSIEIEAPYITYEGNLSGSNLTKIQENIDAFIAKLPGQSGGAASPDSEPESTGGKKMQVDEVIIRNAKVKLALTVLGGRGASITLPEIRLTNLGQGPEGITGAEVLKAVWNEIVKATTEKVTGPLGGFGKGALETGEKILKGIGDMFKKGEK